VTSPLPPGLPPHIVVARLLQHPRALLVCRWNYKSAVMSALCRGPIFFAANLSAGPDAALAAMCTEFVFRFATSGFYGAITQAFRASEPAHRMPGLVAAFLMSWRSRHST
jgi:hypothetical protein